jgi:hypothetical protein
MIGPCCPLTTPAGVNSWPNRVRSRRRTGPDCGMKTSGRELAEAERAVARYCVTATPLAGVWRGGQ